MGQELLGLESQGWSGLVGRTSSLGDQLLQRKLGLGCWARSRLRCPILPFGYLTASSLLQLKGGVEGSGSSP